MPIQRAAKACDVPLDVDMTDWHLYQLVWRNQSTSFSVDGRVVLEHAPSPAGPLGFVLWLDNQYAVVTPWGKLRYGLLETSGRQWMEIDEITIEPFQMT